MTEYSNLDDALADVARRSFYESCRVYRFQDSYFVTDWHSGVDDFHYWDYDTGIDLSGVSHLIDHSRVHAPYEFYETADHIRYNLETALESIESGVSVGFTYVIAEELCDDETETGAHESSTCLECDGDGSSTIGWALIATNETSY